MTIGSDPNKQCIRCGHYWRVAEESCPDCGFDPVDNEQDEAEQEQAIRDYSVQQGGKIDGF